MSDSPTNSVASTLALFRDLALLRRGPEELPVSWGWLLASAVGQAVLGMVIAGVLPPLPPTPGVMDHTLAVMVIDVVVVLLWAWAILQAAGRSERFRQMTTAVFGIQLVLQPFLVTASWAVGYVGKDSGWGLPALMLASALSMWTIFAMARVLRAATDWQMFPCAILMIAQGVATWLVAFAMFPDMAELLKQAQ